MTAGRRRTPVKKQSTLTGWITRHPGPDEDRTRSGMTVNETGSAMEAGEDDSDGNSAASQPGEATTSGASARTHHRPYTMTCSRASDDEMSDTDDRVRGDAGERERGAAGGGPLQGEGAEHPGEQSGDGREGQPG